MQLFVGLGNPGREHARQRHNIGFMAVEAIADRHGFSPWRAKFRGLVSEGRLGGDKVLLLKPQTYMNRSGDSVREAARFYKLETGDVTVFHDELDLAPGRVRVKAGGGHAGHNGLRSIHSAIGEAYVRVRLGIGHPGDKAKVTGYVLHDFPKAEVTGWLEPLLDAVAGAAPRLVAGDRSGFAAEVGQAVRPAAPETGGKPAKPAPAKTDAPGAAEPPAGGDGASGGPFAALARLVRGEPPR
jgi:PTH1 family peptidyl-tRNA hydrolase